MTTMMMTMILMTRVTRMMTVMILYPENRWLKKMVCAIYFSSA